MRTHADLAPAGVSRRALLQGTLAGGFVLAFHVPGAARAQAGQGAEDLQGRFVPNAFIRIDRSGTTTLVMPQVEMGQGTYTSIAMILAEELDADFSRVVLRHAPADEKLYVNPLLGIQTTGNSNSIRAFWKPLRSAAASARATLVQAGAARWQVPASECSASKGHVVHARTGRELAYGELAEAAAALPPVKDAPLKDPARFTLIGRSLKRLDTPGKVNGTAAFGIDTLLPGMKFATLAASPVVGGKVRKVDDRAARAIPGVHKVVVLDDLVAVVGDHMWAAKQGLAALKVAWDDGPHGRASSQGLWEQLRTASTRPGVVAKSVGDARKHVAGAVRVAAAYELPLLAHATMEPLNCTVQVRRDGCEVWLGTQVMARVQQAVAKVLALPPEKVTVHNHLLGGGFGRRLEADMAASAARIAQRLEGIPVKVVWSREEDMRQDYYRPMYRDIVSATLGKDGVESFDYKVCGSSVVARFLPAAFQKGIDVDAVDGAVDMPYAIPNLRIEYLRVEPKAVRTGFWRGVGCNNNVFAIESFMDELAARAGKDPIAFRLAMLGKSPRMKAVLELAAARSGWGQPIGPRAGRGVCAQAVFHSFIATVVEAEVDPQGEVRVRKVTCVVDTGIAVHPDTVVAQLEGGIVFGLSAALHGDISLKNGRIEQSNFHDYRVLRMNEVPRIDVHVLRSGEAPGGIGETGTAAAPPRCATRSTPPPACPCDGCRSTGRRSR
ncbi:xanthine dehydrogenase family protein molybdopterin-binding subunit [Ramlibacter montanisoli]|uniref:xanthine dehydrogenase family protein molybdopterin-binding subunit n=1 Tax=Ramlibacter montanisoli TaxID=2732512 RepID=UPI001C0EE12A|nr:molybdopterin cofactor-binding domain-containing protein [Ramlibacter montanisoli]